MAEPMFQGPAVVVFLALFGQIFALPTISTQNGSIIISIPVNSTAKIVWLSDSGQQISGPCSIATQCDLDAFRNDVLSQLSALSLRLDSKADSSAMQILNSSVQGIANNIAPTVVEVSLGQSLRSELSRAQNAESSISLFASAALASERSRAMASENTAFANEASLSIALASTASSLMISDSSLSLSLTVSAASLLGAVNAERSRAISSETAEVLRAGGVEFSLQASIAAGVAADGILSTAIAAERARAIVAESSLAISQGTVVTSLIALEQSRATAVEASLGNSINPMNANTAAVSSAVANERTRALGAESSISTALSTAVLIENNRALGVESSLAMSHGAIRAETALIALEQSRATTVEASLGNSISAERSRALVAESILALTVAATGCASGPRVGFVDQTIFPTIAACNGVYTGDIGGAVAKALCSSGWHVCRGSDAILATITLAEATGFSGCYAYDSAHDCNFCSATCQAILGSASTPCYVNPTNDADLAGIGAGCSYSSGGPSGPSVGCLNAPRMDAYAGNWGCIGQPSTVAGVVCCKGP